MSTLRADDLSNAELRQRRPWLRHYEPGVPVTLDYPGRAFHALLDETAAKFPDHDATIFFGAKLRYRELHDAVNRFAAALQDMGVRKGNRVALYLPNTPQFIIAYYGALKTGAIVTAINPLYVEREVEHQLNDSAAEVVVVLSRYYHIVRAVRARTKVRHVIVTNIKEYFPAVLRVLFTLAKEKKEGDRVSFAGDQATIGLPELLSKARPQPDPTAVAPEDVALLQYTGGTTGVPKAAVLTHGNLVANVMQASAWLPGMKLGAERFMGVLPFFHAYGMVMVVGCSIANAGTVIVVPRFVLKEVLQIVSKQRPTLFHGVPTMYIAINNAPDIGKFDLRTVRACVSGAAPLPLEVADRFQKLINGRLVEGYGLTEAAPLTHANPVFGQAKAGSIGLPVPDMEARIVDLETGERDLPCGEAGELVVRGPNVMQGYWNRPEETSHTLRDGWLHTGDIAKMDEDGYFYIVDRKKDLIIAGGFNIYPREIEEVLYEHPKVKEGVAVGIPDVYRGETVKVYIVLKDGQEATTEEILEFCRGKLAKYKVPSAVEFREQLPKTLVGKFLRRVLLEEELRKRAGEGG